MSRSMVIKLFQFFSSVIVNLSIGKYSIVVNVATLDRNEDYAAKGTLLLAPTPVIDRKGPTIKPLTLVSFS